MHTIRFNPPANAASFTTEPQARRHAPARGISLVEMLCGLAITSVLLGNAAPGLQAMHQRQALASSASLLETDIQLARSQAMAINRTVRLTVQAPATGGTCYIVHTGNAGSCQCSVDGVARCNAGVQLFRAAGQPPATGIRLGNAGRSIVFDAGKGTVTPTATFVFSDRSGRVVHQIVNIVGRTRSCTPTGTPGYPACR